MDTRWFAQVLGLRLAGKPRAAVTCLFDGDPVVVQGLLHVYALRDDEDAQAYRGSDPDATSSDTPPVILRSGAA